MLTLYRRPIFTTPQAISAWPARLWPGLQKVGQVRVMVSSTLALRAVLEAPGLVSGFHDLAVMGQVVEECRRYLGITKHRRPFAEGKVRGDDDRGALVEPADQME